eukprot:TRINITY_DN1261_c0_g2_i1.p1 TRINITY_DN1261_c0_g2~~TRINITY_DN1261_c0_g2_i1.p1  ORF type:complete len:362 (-),score=86.64 TRINITY_DN1261_c0_g2_i1:314-1399(-)
MEGGLLQEIVTAEKELRSVVWSSFLIDDMTLFIKYKFTRNAYYLIITDTQSVWVKCCEGRQVVSEKEIYAPSLVAPVEDILETLRNYFVKAGGANGRSEVELNCKIAETTLSLVIQAQLDFLKLEWDFKCELMRGEGVNPQLFIRDYFVLPLLAIANKRGDNSNNNAKKPPLKRTRSLKSDELSEINTVDPALENPTFPCDESSSLIYQQFISQRCEPANIKRTSSTLRRTTTFLALTEETISRSNSFLLQYNSSDDEEDDKAKPKKRRSRVTSTLSMSFSQTQQIDSLEFENNSVNNNDPSQPAYSDSQGDISDEKEEGLNNSFDESPEELKRRKDLEEKLLAKTKKTDKLKDRKKLLGI